MLYVLVYDISDDRRRYRVDQACLDFGRRVQESVFECDLDDTARDDLWRRILDALHPTEDSCRLYRLCAACQPEVRIAGSGEPFHRPPFLIV